MGFGAGHTAKISYNAQLSESIRVERLVNPNTSTDGGDNNDNDVINVDLLIFDESKWERVHFIKKDKM